MYSAECQNKKKIGKAFMNKVVVIWWRKEKKAYFPIVKIRVKV